MTAEVLIAIALLCQNTIRNQIPLSCQQEYINCVKLQTEDVNKLGRALANCVKDKK